MTGLIPYLEDYVRMLAVVHRRPCEITKDLPWRGIGKEGSILKSHQRAAIQGDDLDRTVGSKVRGIAAISPHGNFALEHMNPAYNESEEQARRSQHNW